MSGGACRSTAFSVVVTPLTLSKSLSVKMATRMSGRLGQRARRGRADEIEEQRLVEALLEDEVASARASGRHTSGRPSTPPSTNAWRRQSSGLRAASAQAVLVEAGGQAEHVGGHREVVALPAADCDAAGVERGHELVAVARAGAST